MRRWLLPALLLLVATGAMGVAVQAPSAAPVAGAASWEEAEAPVLSVRRVPGLLSRAVADGRLHAQLTALLSDEGLGRATVESCLVVEHGDRVLLDLRSGQALIPASNVKVLTGAAALTQLPPGERLRTEVRAEAPPRDGVVDGDLWLVGGGDPLLATAEYAATFRNQPQSFTPIEQLADKLANSGVRVVTGSIIGDESRYDTVRYVPSWRASYITDNESGPMSALIVNDGFSQVKPTRVAATAPATHAASVLTALLQARGVRVDGAPGQGKAPASATEVAVLESLAIGDVVAEMLIESDNLTAELLVKELGYRATGEGSTAAGLTAIRETLTTRTLDVGGLQLVDGSGLDRSDRASCGLLMDAIDLVGPDSALAKGFPVAGRTGTLATRFKGNPAEGRLRAKTGSLDFVVGLTGFVDGTAGGPLEFSLLANGLPNRLERGRILQEQVGAVLARYPEAPDPATLGPGAGD